ncbi:MAG: ATP-binding protein [Proteobacteria bacterium]|nr:ATP-binding protein [Pseudomonadota bacterium]
MESKLYKRALLKPATSFFLLGMRGTGKSSWVQRMFPKAFVVNLLDEALYQELLVNPSLLRKMLLGLRRGSWVVIDEVQRIPSLLNEVHRSIEELGLKFALLGSSARKLRRDGVNLLGGRALQKYMYPLIPIEMEDDYDISRVLHYGSLPLIVAARAPAEQLRGYVQSYLREEIQVEALVRNLPGFARFLQVAALFHGQVMNVDGVARDAGVARTTVQGYVQILEDTLLAFRLRAFEGRLRVKEKRHPKLYWVDAGVARAAKNQLGAPTAEERGHLLEGVVIQAIRASRDYGLLKFDELYYWSTGSVEVDLLLSRGNSFTAIEVKATQRLRPEHLRGLNAIQELPGVKRRLLVYEGERRFIEDGGIEVVPIKDFIEMLSWGLK